MWCHRKSFLIPTRDAWRAQTKACVHQDPEKGIVTPPQEIESDCCKCLKVFCKARGQGLLQQQSWGTQLVAQVLLEEVTISHTIEPPGGQSTNWRTIIPNKFSHCCKSSRPHNRLHNLRIQQKDWESSGNLTLKVSGIWLRSFHRTGETETLGGEKSKTQKKPCVREDPGERSSDCTRDWTRLACECLGVSGRCMGW